MAPHFPGMLALLAAAAALRGAVAQTPMEKVIDLLDGMKTEVEDEGAKEAESYDKFACFCKSSTATKSESITSGRDEIDRLSSEIEEKTASEAEKSSELKERKAKQEETAAELKATEAQCAKDEAEYEATAADLSKAIGTLEKAIQALEGTKPASFLALRQSVESALALADALDLVAAPARRDVSAFLQLQAGVDPSDPEYKYHSQGIIDTLAKLKEDFDTQKTEVDGEWEKTKKTCDDTKSSLSGKLEENKGAMEGLEGDIEQLKGEIATTRKDLLNEEGLLKDDQTYLKDLTERCEVRAKDWDQRAQLRSEELAAITGALKILKEDVSSADENVNKRALLHVRARPSAARPAAVPAARLRSGPSSSARGEKAVSFLQGVAAKGKHSSFLRGRAHTGLSTKDRQERVATLLGDVGHRLGSTALSTLAMRMAEDPFTKVKTLIQQLIERLLAEATAEATKQGFCEKELGKAKKDRDYRWADARKLSVEIEALEAKQDELEAEIEELTAALGTLREDLKEATEARKSEKEANLAILKEAKAGLGALMQATTILKTFYKKAAKAKMLLQVSPLDEDTEGAGFSGAYSGKQEGSKAILALLDTVKQDFQRTIRVTGEMEREAAVEFVKFERAAKVDIEGKETKKTLDEEDLATTKTSITQKTEDLQAATNLMDSALKVLEDLQPTCVDTGMSYEDRVAKREEELKALKEALCILDTEGKEPEC